MARFLAGVPQRLKDRSTVLAVLAALGVGGAVAAFGVFLHRRPATCEGEEMSRGDTCVTEQGSREITRRSYDEVLESQQTFAVIVILVGCLVVLVALGFVVSSLWSRGAASRSSRGLSMAKVPPMLVIVLGAVALVGGVVVTALNVEPAFDAVTCEGEPMEQGDYCAATSSDYTDQEFDQKGWAIILMGAGAIAAMVGLAAVVSGRRARRTGHWSVRTTPAGRR